MLTSFTHRMRGGTADEKWMMGILGLGINCKLWMYFDEDVLKDGVTIIGSHFAFFICITPLIDLFVIYIAKSHHLQYNGP